uniref:Protein kinase domain-containing protein n=2 Tax=Acrobeloides nanus TaxID=290746 RepID=A0A914DH07_9BILA
MYEKIEEMIAFVQDMCKMVDFRQISDKNVHHRIYYEFDKILGILQRFEKEIYFMATKLIPKEAFDFFHNQGMTQIKAEGADGQVYTMNLPSHTYALKTALNKGVGMKKYMDRFLDLDHINVLKYKYCLQTQENIDPRTSTGIPNAVMMEHCIESLENYINDHERYISRYFYLAWAFEIVSGMEYLHYYHIIHRDLKPDNILLNHEGMIKIADLDRATSEPRKDNLPMSVMGSYRYMAPEYLAPSDYKIPADKKIDVWSYGVILWQMFTRKRPYDSVDKYTIETGMYQKLIGESDKYPQLDILPETPEPLKLLIQKCLTYKAEDRVTLDYIIDNFVPLGRSIIKTSEEEWKEITRHKCGIESADKQYEHYTAVAIARFLNIKEDKSLWGHKQLMEDICRMIN